MDVSVPIHNAMAHWPGDPAPLIERVLDMNQGKGCNLSRLTLGAHTGTHMDAPLHFIRDGAPLDRLPLDAVVGPARVIAIEDRESVKPQELARHALRPGQRVLFKTANSPRCWETDQFVEDFVFISPEAAEYLAKRRVRTVGVDYLSVGGFKRGGAETHRALLGAGIWLIEGLDLTEVKPGWCDLVCLPLKAVGVEGAPARVILRPRKRGIGRG
jgi:arylformamidase